MMSGLALNSVVRIGDAVLVDGEHVEVSSLDWRSVTARRADGHAVVLPNAHLVTSTLQVVPHDRSVRAEIKVEVPAGVPPHRVRHLVTDLVTDFAAVDSTRAVGVLPMTFRISLVAVCC